MHFLAAAQLLVMIIAPMIFFVLRILGIGFITYVGSNLVIDQAKEYLLSKAGSVGLPLQQVLGLAQVDIAINIFFSAIATRMVLSGLNKAQDKRRSQVWKKPGGTSIEA